MDEAQIKAESEIGIPPEAEVKQETVAPQAETQEDKDWIKRLRRDRDEAIRKSNAQEQEIKLQKEMLARVMTAQAPIQAAPEEDVLGDIEREEYVPGIKVAKGIRKLEAKYDKKLEDLEKKYQAKVKESEYQNIKRDYPDLEDVVNSETIAILEEKHPRLARSIANTPDPIDKAIQAYEYIKAMGLVSEVPGQKRMAEVDKKLESKKVVPASTDSRPIVQAFQTMSKAQNQALYAEMMSASARGGGQY